MNFSFIIRRATAEDADAIKDIIEESFKRYMEIVGLAEKIEALEESVDEIKNDIETKEVYIALIDGIPVGTIRIQILPDNTAYISRFGVRLEYNNIGVGKALISLADKVIKSHGVHRAYLHTAAKHRDLVRFYYDRGFYIDSTTKDKGYVRALMVKEYL